MLFLVKAHHFGAYSHVLACEKEATIRDKLMDENNKSLNENVWMIDTFGKQLLKDFV